MSTIEFNDLLIGNSDFLKPFAFTLTKDNDAAKDLVQETLYKALSNKDKYHVGTNVKAWMYTIMRNTFINNYRRKARQHTTFDNSSNDFLINVPQATTPNDAEVNLRLKDIRTAVHRLPDLFRLPFQMYFEGYKYFEIAQTLHEPLGTIKSRIHFARKLLKDQLTRW